eukprot:m.76761 g.76761  ORF g.76761 m.76761 type:complete len:377 (+) comp9087_c0_seq3:106-1236(+)
MTGHGRSVDDERRGLVRPMVALCDARNDNHVPAPALVPATPSLLATFQRASTGAAVAALLLQPLDVIKSRQQYAAALTQGRPPSVIAMARETVRQEGPLALWNGLGPSLIRVSGGVGLYFTFLHIILDQTGVTPSRTPHTTTSDSRTDTSTTSNARSATVLWAGGAARGAAAVVMHPISVVKSRMETYRIHGYTSSWAALRAIGRNEGIGGLYAGLGATLLRDVPYSAAYILFYKQLLSAASRWNLAGHGDRGDHVPAGGRHDTDGPRGTGRLPVSITFSAGLLAGFAATVVSHPFDVVKTRLQLHRLPQPDPSVKGRLLGVGGVLRHVFETEGFAGAWRGLPLRMLRRPLQTAITWTVYGLFAGDQGLLAVLSGR